MAEEPSDNPRPLAEISHGPSAFEAFLDRNQKGMIVLGIALVSATAGWIVFRGIKDGAEKSAGAVLSKADDIPALQDLIKSHPDTPAAGSAQLVIASKQWDAGDQAASVETLRAFIAGNAGHPALPSARASLASRLWQQGQTEEAEGLFRELADAPDAKFIAPLALISLGDIAKSAGRLDDAEKSYKRVQDEFAKSPFAETAGNHLRMLRFKLPVEIKAPPASEPKGGDAAKPEGLEGANLPKELKGNPLGAIIGSQDPVTDPAAEPAVEAPPAETPAVPAEEPVAPPSAEPVAPPTEEPVAPPADGESN
jgi:predicted negative regulator of RcsB-dependent stress response